VKDSGHVNIHPAVDRALRVASAYRPEAAASAALFLQDIAGDLLTSAASDEKTWAFSALNRVEFPIEFAFVSGDDSIRYTTEVTGPQISPAERLNRAETIFSRLTGTILPGGLGRFLHTAQRSGNLKYGAWISGRHRDHGNSFKIYAEIPCDNGNSNEVTTWEQRIVKRPPVLPSRGVRLCMVGYSADSGGLELYYDTRGLMPGEIATLMSRIGLESRAEEVRETLQRAYRRPIRRELPGSDFGFSYALPPKGGPVVFSLYTFANALFGGDSSIRSAVLELARVQGWDASLYQEISKPLENTRGFITHHGVFGIVAPKTGPLAVTFGLAPPQETI